MMSITSNLRIRGAMATPTVKIISRIAGGVLGGYVCSAALVALIAAALPLAGVARSEAVVTAAMLGFLLYLMILLWAFSVRSLWRLWGVLAGGSVLAGMLLWLIRP